MTMFTAIQSVGRGARDVGRFALYVASRFNQDGGARIASALSYTSILALVPLAAISLAVISAFPAFQDFRSNLLLDLYDYVLPHAQSEIKSQFEHLVENARNLTAVGIVALAITAVLLLSTIVGAMNRIWRVSKPPSFAIRILIYWAILTLGPMMFGVSLTWTSQLYATAEEAGIRSISAKFPMTTYVIPAIIEVAGFSLIYVVVPNVRVRWKHALIGGIVAMILFEVLKNGFGYFLAFTPAYQTVYGALASIPILLLWMFAVWAVFILGAEVVAALPEWRDSKIDESPSTLSGQRRLMVALGLLQELAKAHREGRPRRYKSLLSVVPAAPSVIDAVLKQLDDGGFAVTVAKRGYTLGRDLGHVSLYDLIDRLGLCFDAEKVPKARDDIPWTSSLRKILADSELARRGPLMETPAALFDSAMPVPKAAASAVP